ncbi:sporulation protein Cse60 [Plebeiibacterium marinum]|uniref:Sporulation protein Cse60 n=1 Tax=Plebeiibacterium marinum TaxID=2992111 RepID=A0AAE3SKX1_9BACT|nr:sporulation protein Cse60 [Plebeiobacterium marinum]MCW3807082.1 sporulation protein Cse60 [Plebeiobacterium marinum]
MSKIKTKHFQYTGVDDFDKAIDQQINDYLNEKSIDSDNLIDVKYSAHSSQGVNTYSALLIYQD